VNRAGLAAPCLWLAGCLGPALRPVAPPGPGEVVVSAAIQFPDLSSSSTPLEVSATAAVGVAPHWAVQAEAGWDPELDWVVGGGVRYTRPIDAWQSLDVSLSYDQISVKPAQTCSFLGFGGLGSSGSGGGGTGLGSGSTAVHSSNGLETAELGLLIHKPDSALWTGVWFDGVVGQSYGADECLSQGLQFNAGAGLRLGVDIVPKGSFLHLLLGASAMVPANWPSQFMNDSQSQENSEQLSAWFSVGLGLAAYF
jgi:hypothetical protein